jgi:hypothetical protein
MARERWFFAQGNQRRGPAPFSQLVESVLGQPDPRAVLVWRKGFADWTRAEDVPEVERKIAPFLARKEAEAAAKRAPTSPLPQAPPPTARVEEAKPGSPALVYGGIAEAWRRWSSSRLSGRGPAHGPGPACAPRRHDRGERPAVVIRALPVPLRPRPAPSRDHDDDPSCRACRRGNG